MILGRVREVFAGRVVLVTGHTGFKGGWLSAWLASLGAKVIGFALPPDQGIHNLFERAGVEGDCYRSDIGDIRDYDAVHKLIAKSQPDIVFHLAAQPLVRRSYQDPLLTFSTNVMGTAHVLEAARQVPSVQAVVVVTTDKVYDNNEWVWGYREIDQLGGHDAYSASKAAAEIVTKPYMTVLKPAQRQFAVATARGGNVVGGGDWAQDRIIPDIIRSLAENKPLVMRNPQSTRPWQHVLDLCFGYILLATRLVEGWPERNKSADAFSGSWNFGPDQTGEMTVSQLVSAMLDKSGKPDSPIRYEPSSVPESGILKLDSTKSRRELGWSPVLNTAETIDWTAAWYQQYLVEPTSARALMKSQISDFEALIKSRFTRERA